MTAPRNKRLIVRLTDGESAAIAGRARQLDLTASECTRRCAVRDDDQSIVAVGIHEQQRCMQTSSSQAHILPKESSNRNSNNISPNVPKAPSGTIEGKRRASEYIHACQSHIAECACYLEERGIPLTFAMDHGLGYDPRKSMLIIPYPGTSYYIGRSTLPNARIRHLKPKSCDVGPEPIFNEKALEADYVIVTEGAIDCLSIEKLGLNAVAIGGASSWQRLTDLLKAREIKPAALVLFDRDATGITSSRAFANSLSKAGVRSSIPSPPTQLKGKDPNEWLLSDDRLFSSFLKSEIESLLGGCHEE